MDLDRNLNLAFGPNDEEDFLAAQATLLDRFAQWLAEVPPARQRSERFADDVGVAPSWKWATATATSPMADR